MIDIIYIRTSTTEQNPENQLKDCEEIAPKNSIVYKEQQSAWKDNLNQRPIFRQIYELIRKKQVKSFTVWDLDRIYRKRIKTVAFMQTCRHLGVKVQSFRQPYFHAIENMPEPWNDIVRDQMIQILGWIAEEESNKKSDRMKIAYKNYKGNDWGRPKVKVDINNVLNLKSKGKSIRNIAKELGISKTKVHEVIKKNVLY